MGEPLQLGPDWKVSFGEVPRAGLECVDAQCDARAISLELDRAPPVVVAAIAPAPPPAAPAPAPVPVPAPVAEAHAAPPEPASRETGSRHHPAARSESSKHPSSRKGTSSASRSSSRHPSTARFQDRATQPARGPADILKWRLSRGPKGPSDRGRARPAPSQRWLGYSQPRLVPHLGGARQLSCCAWAASSSPSIPSGRERLAGVAPQRRVEPRISLDAIPPLEVVLVSHNHYDHLDAATLRRIGPEAHYVVPAGNARWLEPLGLTRITELDLVGEGRARRSGGDPWSPRATGRCERRGTATRRCGAASSCAAPEGTTYHSGDTALFDGFKEIGARLGPIDWALLPIGAYEPRWFMQPQHMNPEDALEAFDMLGARTFVAMHWGTFKLTDEPVSEPPRRTRELWSGRPSGGGAPLDPGHRGDPEPRPVRPDRATSDPVYELALRWLSQRDRTASQLQDRLSARALLGPTSPGPSSASASWATWTIGGSPQPAPGPCWNRVASVPWGSKPGSPGGHARPEARAVVRELMEGQDESTWARTLVMRRGQGALPSTPREQARERRSPVGARVFGGGRGEGSGPGAPGGRVTHLLLFAAGRWPPPS